MSGEEAHDKGADGARRAKLYLESTTRSNVHWVNPLGQSVRKLTFPWADEGTFSFDLGGVLRGGELEGQEFLAESKYYKSASDQGTHYECFVARCFRAYVLRPDRCDNFLWVTWSPFLVTRWDEIRTAPYVLEAVLKYRKRVFNFDGTLDEAKGLVSDDTVKEVAERLRILLLTDWQEKLVPLHGRLIELIDHAVEGKL